MVSLTVVIDEKRYARLLVKATPRVIRTEAENDRALVESLMEKGERNLTPEEGELVDRLANLICNYEAEARLPRQKSKPHEMVAFLLEQRGLAPKDLWPVVGSRSRVSEILAGKRSITKGQAKRLAEFFRVGVGLFL